METETDKSTKKNSKKWKKWKQNKKGRTPNTITFDEEIVTKKQVNDESEVNENLEFSYKELKRNKKHKKKKNEADENDLNMQTNEVSNGYDENLEEIEDKAAENSTDTKSNKKIKKKKKKSNKEDIQIEDSSEEPKSKKKRKNLESETNEDLQTQASGESKKKDSIREIKRKRHAQLLHDKKLKTELSLQQKSLNYLSKWKHNRSEWKFEKLRQIWLQQNIYDTAKIPEEFWDTLVEYFGSSMGQVKDKILKDAIKLIETENVEDEENVKKVARARNIVQNLQE